MTNGTIARQVVHPIDPDFVGRWSPSADNSQPWRFVYVLRDGPRWTESVDILLLFNEGSASNVPARGFIPSDSLLAMPGEEPAPAMTASFDAGAACAFLALQAIRLGLHTHAMAGLSLDRADPELLPETLRARETPSLRREIAQIASRDAFADLLREA